MHRYLTLAALILWVFVSLAVKANRYGNPGESRQSRTEKVADDLMALSGWRPVAGESIKLSAGTSYAATAFRHPGCTDPIYISILGAGSGFADVIKGAVGGKVSFLEGGRLADTADERRLLMDVLIATATGWLDGGDKVPSIVAIAPPPVNGSADCTGPTANQWSGLRLLR